MCHARGSEGFDSAARARGLGKIQACPAGYTLCNGGAKSVKHRTCQPTGSKCPIVTLTPIGTAVAAAAAGCNAGSVSFADGTKMHFSDCGEGLPLVHISPYAAQSDAARLYGGRCYGNDPERHLFGGKAVLPTYRIGMPGGCGTGVGHEDTRYTRVDALLLSTWLPLSFQADAQCANVWGLNTGADYLASPHVPCAASIAQVPQTPTCGMAGTDLTRSDTTGPSPSPSIAIAGCDGPICDKVMFQSKCGKLRRFATQSPATSQWGLYKMQQIIWKDGCSATYDDIKRSNEILDDAVDVLGINLAFSITGNILVGLFLPLFVILHYAWPYISSQSRRDLPCCPGTGAMEAQILDVCITCLGPMFTIAKVTCSAVAFAAIGKIKGTFSDLKDSPCSDPTTDYTMNYLGEELPAIYDNTIANFVLEFLMMFYTIYHIYGICVKCRDGKFGKEDDEGGLIVN